MTLDPQAQRLLEAARGLPPVETLSVREARWRFIEASRPRGEPEVVYRVEDRFIPGLEGEIPVRIYTPGAEPSLPVLAYFHGGGGVVGNLDTHDGVCRTLANGAGCIVVAVDYRLAPEHKYPAALHDCFSVTQWLLVHAASIQGDPRRVAVGGDSAGASLAAGVALLARDRGDRRPVFQLLFYPMTDYCEPGTQSYEENGTGYFLTTSGIKWFLNHYLPEDFNRDDPYLFPLRSKKFTGLPPALIMTAQYDPLRDDGHKFAQSLKKAGIPVYYKCIEGMMHGFTVMFRRLSKGQSAIQEAALYLKHIFKTYI